MKPSHTRAYHITHIRRIWWSPHTRAHNTSHTSHTSGAYDEALTHARITHCLRPDGPSSSMLLGIKKTKWTQATTHGLSLSYTYTHTHTHTKYTYTHTQSTHTQSSHTLGTVLVDTKQFTDAITYLPLPLIYSIPPHASHIKVRVWLVIHMSMIGIWKLQWHMTTYHYLIAL